jgi:hypothetical protein
VKREYSLGKETLRNAERSNAEPFREQAAQRSRIAAVVVHLQVSALFRLRQPVLHLRY